MGGIFFSMNAVMQPWILSPSVFPKVLKGLDKVVAESPQFLPWLLRGGAYSAVRGWYGVTYALMGSHWGDFGFHPKDIQTKKVAVWYASDDTQQDPLHGEILAEIFKEKEQSEGIKCEVQV